MPRRLSWKTAHRKNRATTSNPTEPNISYLQQLNPYKPSSSLRGSANVQDDGNFERNVMSTRRRPSVSGQSRDNTTRDSSFENDSLGNLDDDLDNILSGIEREDDDRGGGMQSLNPPAEINVEKEDLQITSCGQESITSDKIRIQIRPVDFGNSDTATNDNARADVQGDVSLHQAVDYIFGESESTLNREVLPQNNKSIEKAGRSSTSSSLDDSTKIKPYKNSESVRAADPPLDRSTKSLVDEIIEDGLVSQTDSIDAAKSHAHSKTSQSIPQCKGPLESGHNKTSTKLDPIESIPRNLISNKTYNSSDEHKNDATNIFGVVHHHHNQADDTISTVTEQTDSPYIFTYQKSNDDDSVSQITSSLAPSLASSILKNIPQGKGLSASNNRFKSAAWINSGRQTTKRGAVVAGTFGRDRNRHGRGNNAMSSAISIGSNGTADSPYQEGNSNLDEIAYAINASSGIQRPRRGIQEFDLCTIDSEKSGVSRRRSNFDSQSNVNVSALGNGGVSCTGQSVTNGSVSRGSSSRSGGLVHGFALLARKAERFFLPTSPEVWQNVLVEKKIKYSWQCF
jgi:hypothetical protein